MIRYESKATTTVYTIDEAYGICYGAWSRGFGRGDVV